ncbi:cytochrome c oxidase subunit 3 [Haliscomenobacter hydrossis]|uniref:Cytochrome c oxidase subunit III n=1 Tax=Haliscomenobacter hydrossis (strain ATCC 27775 / DSM 1100 / LMG 10767 / O) TaxID=760192 RepID=F4L3T3_HALH1|nr:cytochrome c oxidase subunit 3 [Haliscomenobacter hydrossis]AEE48687.1 cytochrome c oxidase subunit III [Haliscomenobacter hydrossis DSM 1100]
MSNQEQEQPHNEYAYLAFHPKNVILVLLLIGLSTIFIALSLAYVYNRVNQNLPPLRLPILFLFNTLILLGSSAAMVWAKKSYLADHTDNYQTALWCTLGLSLLFMLAQAVAWYLLFSDGVLMSSDNSAGYLYVISGLHFAHVIAGLPFLGYFIYQARYRMKEPVSVLIYFSDPEKRLSLRLLGIYWHFLDVLWIYLVIFFYVNYFIR